MMTRLLPDDALAAVLARLAPRGLAACRCVCRAWRAVVDARGLLRADLLPRSLAGLFLSYNDLRSAKFFARPSVDYDYDIPNDTVRGHSNGLLLQYGWVCNPVTGEYVSL